MTSCIESTSRSRSRGAPNKASLIACSCSALILDSAKMCIYHIKESKTNDSPLTYRLYGEQTILVTLQMHATNAQINGHWSRWGNINGRTIFQQVNAYIFKIYLSYTKQPNQYIKNKIKILKVSTVTGMGEEMISSSAKSPSPMTVLIDKSRVTSLTRISAWWVNQLQEKELVEWRQINSDNCQTFECACDRQCLQYLWAYLASPRDAVEYREVPRDYTAPDSKPCNVLQILSANVHQEERE